VGLPGNYLYYITENTSKEFIELQTFSDKAMLPKSALLEPGVMISDVDLPHIITDPMLEFYHILLCTGQVYHCGQNCNQEYYTCYQCAKSQAAITVGLGKIVTNGCT
jgi:hypothetical protein